jgi:uncharacterized membrane protein
LVTQDDHAFAIFVAVLLTTIVVSLIATVIGLARTNDRLHKELRKTKGE